MSGQFYVDFAVDPATESEVAAAQEERGYGGGNRGPDRATSVNNNQDDSQPSVET